MATHSSVLAWRIPGTGGAWWAAVSGVAHSQTRLKQLSSSSRERRQRICKSWAKVPQTESIKPGASDATGQRDSFFFFFFIVAVLFSHIFSKLLKYG